MTARPASEKPEKLLHVAMLVIGMVACGLASLGVGQDNNWDLRNYHFYNAHAFLTDRIGFDVAPAQRQSYLNPFPDLPFYLAATHLNPRLLGFVMGAIHGLNFGLLFAICFVVFRSFGHTARVGLAALCAGLGVYAPVFVGELGASQNDTLIGLLVLASVFLLVRVLASDGTLAKRESRLTLLLASLLLGMGAGFKLTLLLHAPAAVIAVLVVERTWRNRAVVLLVWSGAFAAGFLIANGYWMARLWQEFRNPFFPFFNDIFRSPWAETRSFGDASMLPRSVGEALARPFAFAVPSSYTERQNQFRDARYVFLFVSLLWLVSEWLGLRLFARARKGRLPLQHLPADACFLLVFFVVSFVVWEAMFSILRYATTLEALAPLLVVVLMCDIFARRIARVLMIASACLVIAAVMRPIQTERVEWGRTFWEVEAPSLPDPSHTMIIVANSRPWAYLVTRFPPGVRWVSLNNNLTGPGQVTRLQGKIRYLISEHEGDLFLLSRSRPSVWLQHDRQILRYYRLEVEAAGPQPVLSKHSRPGLHLYRLRRR